MDKVEKVNKVLKAVVCLSDDEIQAVEQMAMEQINYTHPLKMATQAKFNKLGKQNLKVVSVLRKLKAELAKNVPVK